MNIRLEAPADGVVTARDAEPGSTVIAGQAVFKLQEPNSLWVSVRLDQGRSAGLRMGLPAVIMLRSNPGNALAGKVVRIEPVSDSVTEERIAQVAFDSLPQGVSSGEMAEVTLHPPTVKETAAHPQCQPALSRCASGCVAARGWQAALHAGESGRGRTRWQVQIVEGLKAGDEIVVYSERELKDDSRIKVVSSLGSK